MQYKFKLYSLNTRHFFIQRFLFPNNIISFPKIKLQKLVVSKSKDHKEPFYILTNDNVQFALKHYGYRFGSIEFIFKNQKSNGFYLESTKVRNIQAFTTLFTLACIAILWLTSIGTDYSSHKGKIPNGLKIRNSRKKGIKNCDRILSIFNTGLFLFNLLIDSRINYTLKVNFIIYR